MAGDYSRNTFDPAKHYTRVLMQQGRVQLDADWNEQAALIAHRVGTETLDVIGRTGAPKGDGNFKIALTPDGADLTVAAGRIWIDGILCELEGTPITAQATAGKATVTVPTLYLDGRKIAAAQWLEVTVGTNAAQVLKVSSISDDDSTVTFTANVTHSGAATLRRATTYLTQPQGAPQPLTALTDGSYAVVLDVWEREISAGDDPLIREIALGGPDTARRLETVWRLMLVPVPSGTTCATAPSAVDAADRFKPSTGMLAAQTKRADDEPNPCRLPPTAGYRGLENQLYRVEIQKSGQLPPPGSDKPPTFKWSRDNATVEATISAVSGNTVTVSEIGKDDVLRFKPGDWTEIVDDTSVLGGEARALAQIAPGGIAEATRQISFSGSPAIPTDTTKHLELRRWDQSDPTATADGLPITADTWLDLEANVQVRFAPGLYHSGDYWLIPARTAIHDVLWPPYVLPSTAPEPRPPLGIRHHHTVLAVTTKSGASASLPTVTFSAPSDCRDLFPPLTDIWASDVNYDDTHCLAPAKTVQEALEALCDRSDLQTHNKYLHGWGVVCGLQLRCAGGTNVTVLPGYALTCEGFDVQLTKPQTLDIRKLPGGEALANENEACLVLDRAPDGTPSFRLTQHKHAQKPAEILKGTLLLDFYNDCLKDLSDYFRGNFDPRDHDPNEVTASQRRITALWDLLIQLFNPTNGSKVFLSAAEDRLLREIYDALKKLAHSDTFCALLAGARPLPQSPFDTAVIRTMFGKGTHRRLRVSPKNELAATAGTDDKIDIFELKTGVFLRQIAFPFRGATVRDVVFTGDGRTLVAAATAPGGKDTIIAVTDAGVPTPVWRQQSTISSREIVTLGFFERTQTIVGVALNAGLFRITPGAKAGGTTTQIGPTLAAKGHLALFDNIDRPMAVLTIRHAADASTARYDSIAAVILDQNQVQEHPLNREGDDDIAVFGGSTSSAGSQVVVVVDPAGGEKTKQLLIVDALKGDVQGAIDLQESSSIRLAAFDAQSVAVAYEDSYHLRAVIRGELAKNVIPVQVCPSSIALSPVMNEIYVLNAASRTINGVPLGLAGSTEPVLDLGALTKYRTEMLDAFVDLGFALFETIKDCFCDHLLIDCPTCGENDVIILGCFELQGGVIRQICNLTGRKYVKTFRSVDYWLSLIPVGALLRWGVEKLCCLDFPQLGATLKLPQPGDRDRFHCDDVLPLETFDLKRFVQDQITQLGFKRKIALQTATAYQPKAAAGVDARTLVGGNVRDVQAQLVENGFTVRGTEEYDPTLGAKHVARAASALDPGAPVTIVTRNGRVAYVYASTAVSDTEALSRSIAATTGDVRVLRADVDAQRQMITEREAALAEAAALKTEVTSLRRDLDDVRTQNASAQAVIGELRAANTAAEGRITELTKRTVEIDAMKTAIANLQRQRPG